MLDGTGWILFELGVIFWWPHRWPEHGQQAVGWFLKDFSKVNINRDLNMRISQEERGPCWCHVVTVHFLCHKQVYPVPQGKHMSFQQKPGVPDGMEWNFLKRMIITISIPFPFFRSLKTIKTRYFQLIHDLLLWDQEKSDFNNYRISVGRNLTAKITLLSSRSLQGKGAQYYTCKVTAMVQWKFLLLPYLAEFNFLKFFWDINYM